MSPGGLIPPKPPDIAEIFYTPQDVSPYRIIVESIQDPNNGVVQRINRLKIGKNLQDIGFVKSILDILQINKRKAAIFTDNYKIANEICKNVLLKNTYKIHIPHYLVTVSGVISGVPLEITNEEILMNIKAPNTQVTGIQRLKRKVEGELIDSFRIKVTFRSNKLPENVRLFHTITKVRPFFRKANFCNKCLRYNHSEQHCRSVKRCQNCTKIECEGCQITPKCMYCFQDHKTNDSSCSERSFQNKINKIMSIKNMLYVEAKQFTISGSNIYEQLAYLDDPTPAESTALKEKNKQNSYAYVWKNPRKSRNTQGVQNNPSRSRSISKRRSSNPNVSERQESPEINVPKRTKNDGNGSSLLQVQDIESNQSLTIDQKGPAEAANSHANIIKKILFRSSHNSNNTVEACKFPIGKDEKKKYLTKAIEEKQKEISKITRMHDSLSLSKEEYNKTWEELNNDLKRLRKTKADLEEKT